MDSIPYNFGASFATMNFETLFGKTSFEVIEDQLAFEFFVDTPRTPALSRPSPRVVSRNARTRSRPRRPGPAGPRR